MPKPVAQTCVRSISEVVEQAPQIVGPDVDAVGRRRPVGAPEAARLERDAVEVAEQGPDEIPDVVARAEPAEQDERLSPAPLLVVPERDVAEVGERTVAPEAAPVEGGIEVVHRPFLHSAAWMRGQARIHDPRHPDGGHGPHGAAKLPPMREPSTQGIDAPPRASSPRRSALEPPARWGGCS